MPTTSMCIFTHGKFLGWGSIEASTQCAGKKKGEKLRLFMISVCFFVVKFLFGCNFRNIINSPQAKLKRWNTNGNFNLQHKKSKTFE